MATRLAIIYPDQERAAQALKTLHALQEEQLEAALQAGQHAS